MALTPMAPGGRWVRPPHDAPPVYIPAKQTEAHLKRLFADGWTPIDDPRKDDGTPAAASEPVMQSQIEHMTAREAAMQAQIDQLTALVHQLVAQKEHSHGSTHDADSPNSEGSNADQRPGRRKPAV